ncbi:MAG: response regulator transcription factor [Gammaproteobacteria bacterium]|nr:response regulator transcription factor [Gammaproteobacteria bacterium]MCH9764336.1 response regulator transcription factor [Gammaproteobacteria bacterium]
MNEQILLIDNDRELTTQLSDYLLHEGFEILISDNGETGMKLALNQFFDAIILEVLLPNKNGFELLQTLREHKQTPVLFLSSRKTEVDRLMGLELGGDDYLTKPCDPTELLARLRAILRRSQPTHNTSRPTIQIGNITVDCGQHQASINNQLLDLTNTEFKILEILLKSPGQAFSKEELTEYALNRKFTAYDRSIDVHISNLRQKLGLNTENEPWIKTIRGFGYLFNQLPEHEEENA